MRTIALAAAGAAALLAGAAGVTTTTHAGARLGLRGSHPAQAPSRPGGPLSPNPGTLLACANILHAGGINLIGGGRSFAAGCTDTRYGPGHGTDLLTLAPLPATPILGRCQTVLQNVGGMLPFIGFPVSTGAGLQTSCGSHPSPLDPLTGLLGLG